MCLAFLGWFFFVKFVVFLSSLRWPSEDSELGPGGVPYAGASDSLRQVGWGEAGSGGFSNFGAGAEIWKLCQHLASMMRVHVGLCQVVLVILSLGRLAPSWQASACWLGGMCGLSGQLIAALGICPSKSGAALLAGPLKLKYSTVSLKAYLKFGQTWTGCRFAHWF